MYPIFSVKRWTLIAMLSLVVVCHTTDDESSGSENDNESAVQVVDDLERRASRTSKCPGCHTAMSNHPWGPGHKLCAGDPETIHNPDTRRRTKPSEEPKKPKSKKKSKSKSKTPEKVLDEMNSRLTSAIDSAEAAIVQSRRNQDNQLSEIEYLDQLRQMEREFNEEEATLSAKDEIRRLEKKLEEQQRRLDTLRASASGNHPKSQTHPCKPR